MQNTEGERQIFSYVMRNRSNLQKKTQKYHYFAQCKQSFCKFVIFCAHQISKHIRRMN